MLVLFAGWQTMKHLNVPLIARAEGTDLGRMSDSEWAREMQAFAGYQPRYRQWHGCTAEIRE